MERINLRFSVFLHLCALLLGITILAPFLWLFVMSISSTADLMAKPLHWWPDRLTCRAIVIFWR